MRVTEQIDALERWRINPVRYLVVPRVIAATIMLPVITVFADAIADLRRLHRGGDVRRREPGHLRDRAQGRSST